MLEMPALMHSQLRLMPNSQVGLRTHICTFSMQCIIIIVICAAADLVYYALMLEMPVLMQKRLRLMPDLVKDIGS